MQTRWTDAYNGGPAGSFNPDNKKFTVYFSEFDLRNSGGIYHVAQDDKNPLWTLDAQGQKYYDIIDGVLSLYEKGTIKFGGITWWGLKDNDSWINDNNLGSAYVTKATNEYPLMFDGNNQAKPAYWGVLEALKRVPYGSLPRAA